VFREGKTFRDMLETLRKNEALTYSELRDLQCDALGRQSREARRKIPHYAALFRDHLGGSAVPASHADLQRLPLMTKQQVQGRESAVTRRGVFRVAAATSGTSGTPVNLYRDHASINFENAALWRLRNWAGVQLDDRRAILRGEIVVEAARRRPPYWISSIGGRELILSSFHLSAESVQSYVDAISAAGSVCLEAYPSSAFALASLMEEAGIVPLRLRAVFTSSETLLAHQRATIQRMLGPVFDYYGNGERVAFISSCEHGHYHYMMDYSIVEFLPSTAEGLYQIVGTSLRNRSMPFYRYATGDLARVSGASCPCSRAFPVVDEIEGRMDDMVRTPTGRWIGRLGATFQAVPGVREAQIVQDRLDHLLVRIVPGPGYSDTTRSMVRDKLLLRTGDEMQLDFEVVDTIPRTKSGKFRFLVSQV
jgi:phenylacetate-CoA ligase